MGECPDCGHKFNWMDHFTQEGGGEGVNHTFGITEYWFHGKVTCPQCGGQWDHGDSSL